MGSVVPCADTVALGSYGLVALANPLVRLRFVGLWPAVPCQLPSCAELGLRHQGYLQTGGSGSEMETGGHMMYIMAGTNFGRLKEGPGV